MMTRKLVVGKSTLINLCYILNCSVSIMPVMSRLSLAVILTAISYLFNRYYPLKYVLSEDYRVRV